MSRAFLIKLRPFKNHKGSVWSKVAVKGLPTKNGEKWRKKEKIHWKLIQMNFSADENGKIGITDLEKNAAKLR